MAFDGYSGVGTATHPLSCHQKIRITYGHTPTIATHRNGTCNPYEPVGRLSSFDSSTDDQIANDLSLAITIHHYQPSIGNH